MQFARLASQFDRLAAESGRLGMTAILVELLEEAEPADVEPITYLLQGKVRPDWEGVELGLAEKLVLHALVRAAGMGPGGLEAATTAYRDAGDLGIAAERLLGGAGSAQTGLAAFGAVAARGASVRSVYEQLLAIARTTGKDSQKEKQQRLEVLLGSVDAVAARYIVRIVAGKLRLGVADMTVLDALAAWHLGHGVRSVQDMDESERAARDDVRARLERAYDLCSELALVATTLAADGMDGVAGLGVRVGVPLRPMLAERLTTVAQILEKHGGSTVVETKYDGLRMQVHVGDEVRIFSRRLEDLTGAFPDVVAAVRQAWTGTPGILEGECVAWDEATGRMRPFQELSRRRGRKTDLGRQVTTLSGDAGRAGRDITQEIPVVLFLFDALAVADKDILGQPYTQRRAAISTVLKTGDGPVRLAEAETCSDEAAVETVFQRVVQEAGEGIMCKRADAPYKAGGRGFDWIKFKADYQEGLADSMDLVVVGAFLGRGRRAGWYGALLMACRDGDGYASVCKLGTGFDDATLAGLKDRFAPHVVPGRPADVHTGLEPDVWIAPHVVMEVQAAELTLSPVHRAAWGRLRDGAGLAARFPRFTGRWREDKKASDATTADELVSLYKH